jgi:hypothetical protein
MPRKKIGQMIVNAQGYCVQGDVVNGDTDSVIAKLPSYAVLTGAAVDEADAAIAHIKCEGYRLAPVYEGDIEEPLILLGL